MNRIKTYTFWCAALFITIIVACSRENEPRQEPEWIIDNTVAIRFYSRLTDTNIFRTTDYTGLVKQLQSQTHQAAVLHRADALLSAANPLNPTISVAAKAGKVPFFVKSHMSNEQIKGSGILIGHTTIEMETIPVADGCTWFSVPTYGVTAPLMTFATISFDTESQISPGALIIGEKMDDKTVMAGTINKTLLESLKSNFSSEKYRFVSVEAKDMTTTQVIFVLTTQKWIVRKSTETQVGIEKIPCFEIQIEALE